MEKEKVIEIEIQGTCPLLHNRFQTENCGIEKSKVKKKVYVPEEEAKKSTYYDKEGNIYTPSEHIFCALVKCGSSFIYEKRKTYKEIIKAGIIVEPDCIALLNKEGNVYNNYDEIDARPVVIQRSRVLKWRAKFNNWKLKFNITVINPDELSIVTLKEILDYAGKFNGIGDYRPRFGRFIVTQFKEIK